MSDLIVPNYIAVMGYPTAGKDTVGTILTDLYGYRRLDDGAPIREVCQVLFGWSIEDQRDINFKQSYVEVPGYESPVLVRTVQQDVGRMLEHKFGDDIMPRTAIMRTKALVDNNMARYAATSVRMKQGWTWRKAGALVIEVRRPGTSWDGTESENYDAASCHVALDNIFDGSNQQEAYFDLHAKVKIAVEDFAAGKLSA